jgi:hypothetical protein
MDTTENSIKTNSGQSQPTTASPEEVIPLPLTVGNPAPAASLVIDQKHEDSVTSQPSSASPHSGQPDEAVKVAIAKPTAFSLDKFKSTCGPTIAGVETLLMALPYHNIAGAKDFVRLHPDVDKYWSPELCFVNVPIKGMKHDTLHLIDETIAMRHLPSGRIQRFRLALATKPHDVFFLCTVPSTNLDNPWNSSNVVACSQAITHWLMATSRKGEGVENYKVDFARSQQAFPVPRWPKQPLSELIHVTFTGRIIETDNHPGLLRLVGDVQQIS